MSVLCPRTRLLARALTIAAVATAWALISTRAIAAPGAAVHTGRGCYLVGQKVTIAGTGFAPQRAFEVSVDGIDFGESTTSSAGAFFSSLIPGGLGPGLAQFVHHLDASDGTTDAGTTFTVTRAPGARLLAAAGNPHTLRAPVEVWGFALDSRRRPIYLHYVTPSGRAGPTYGLGTAGGQCGYLRTRPRRVFPFSPSVGVWMLQVDTNRQYASRPSGPVGHIRVKIG